MYIERYYSVILSNVVSVLYRFSLSSATYKPRIFILINPYTSSRDMSALIYVICFMIISQALHPPSQMIKSGCFGNSVTYFRAQE